MPHVTQADDLSLPGQIAIERGTIADYRALEHFHYAPGHPATWAGIWRVAFKPKSASQNPKSRIVAVGVLSYPTPANRIRERHLNLTGPRYGSKLAFVNRHLRTISRVIVHPQFRALGLASQLVRRICDECPTRYVEAIAAMGEVHPFFERGGMRKIESDERGRSYFIFDRGGREKQEEGVR